MDSVGDVVGPPVRITIITETGHPDRLFVDGQQLSPPPGIPDDDALIAYATAVAAERRGPVLAVLTDPGTDWSWRLVVHPDGNFDDLDAPRHSRTPWVLLAVVVVAAVALLAVFNRPAPAVAPVACAPAVASVTPQPSTVAPTKHRPTPRAPRTAP